MCSSSFLEGESLRVRLADDGDGRQNFDAIQRPLILKRLGELYEWKGNAAKGAEHDREFVNLWERADPKLQPKVAEVRRRLLRMADTERK